MHRLHILTACGALVCAAPAFAQGPPPLTARLSSAIENARENIADHIRGKIGGAEGEIAAALIVGVRAGIPELLSRLRTLGVTRTLLLSGDQSANVHGVAKELGISEAAGDLLPEQKVNVIRDLVASGKGVAMIGDGTNDAPALSTATVGIALASHGGGITAEAADVVILVDDLSRLADGILIGKRTMRIARQSIWFGLGLSAAAAGVAALGGIAPVQGALLQEIIDVAVILNALRASKAVTGGSSRNSEVPPRLSVSLPAFVQ